MDDPTKGMKAIDRFTVNLASLRANEEDLDLQIEAQEEMIDRVVRKCTLGDQPAIAILLHISRDPEELARLAKGLERVAPRVEKLDELLLRRKMLKMAKERPNEFALTFADLSAPFSGTQLDDFVSTQTGEKPTDGGRTDL